MAVLYLDGKRLKRIISASFAWLHHNKEELNAINVFPVPDADTGNNMAHTLKSIHHTINAKSIDDHLPTVAEHMSKAALTGARGNSGVILSQIFKGFAEAVDGRKRLNSFDIVCALKKAYEKAYSALSDPREGTILTVVRESVEAVFENAREEKDIVKIIANLFDEANKSLERTTEQLSQLKDAGTVDAGAKGFVYMLEGILKLIKGEKLPESVLEHSVSEAHPSDTIENHFGYCVEFLINACSLDTNLIKNALTAFGDSLIVAGEKNIVKVHIHTMHPGRAIEKGLEFGILSDVKIENMDSQHEQRNAAKTKTKTVKIVTDSTCDLPRELIEEYGISVIPLNVNFEGKSYQDGVDLFPGTFYRMLSKAVSHPATSQPSPESFMRVYKKLTADGSDVLSIHISEKMSGTASSAKIAKRELNNNSIYIVDSGFVSIGLALIARECAILAKKGKGIDEIIALADEMKKKMKVYFAVDTLEFLKKGGRIGRASALIGGLFNIKPVLTVENGMVHPFSKEVGTDRQFESLKVIVEDEFKKNKYNELLIGFAYAGSEELLSKFIKVVGENVKPGNALVVEIGPVVGAHSGPGAVAVALCPMN